jgi:hypothetical protein
VKTPSRKLTPHEADMHAIYRDLPKEIPLQLPAGVLVTEIEGEPGVMVRILRDPGADRFAMVCDTTKDGKETRRIVTPVVTREQILAVAEGVMLGWQRTATWQHAVNVLAMGVAIGLDQPPVLTPVTVAAPEAVAS